MNINVFFVIIITILFHVINLDIIFVNPAKIFISALFVRTTKILFYAIILNAINAVNSNRMNIIFVKPVRNFRKKVITYYRYRYNFKK